MQCHCLLVRGIYLLLYILHWASGHPVTAGEKPEAHVLVTDSNKDVAYQFVL